MEVIIFRGINELYTVGVLEDLGEHGHIVTHYTQIESDETEEGKIDIWAMPIAVPFKALDEETIANIKTTIPRGSYMFYSVTSLDSAHPFVEKFRKFWGL
jgi:hypothetical protein